MPWAFDLTDRVHKLQKSSDVQGRRFKIEEQLTEVTFGYLGQRHVLCLARDLDTDEEYFLKVRYDLNPASLGRLGPLYDREEVLENFIEEIDVFELVNEIGHAPAYVDHANLKSKRYPYPPGWVDLYLMKQVPGQIVTDILTELSKEQRESIKTQLAFILEHMRQHGRILREQHSDFLRYDIENDKLYLVDFTFFGFCDPDDSMPITEDSWFVSAFNINHIPEKFVLGTPEQYELLRQDQRRREQERQEQERQEQERQEQERQEQERQEQERQEQERQEQERQE